MKSLFALIALAASFALVPSSAQAQTLYGDLASWQTAVGSYDRDTAYGTSYDTISSLTLDNGIASSFSSPVTIYTVGSGWATWSGGYTGQVLYSGGASSISATLADPLSAFGFFVQPNPFATYDITLTLSDGSFLNQAVSGTGGADFFGWAGGSVTGYTVGISGQTDFAFGDFYSSSVSGVPEPTTWAMMLLGFGATGFAMRRRRRIGNAMPQTA